MPSSPILKNCFHSSEELAQALNTKRETTISQISLNRFRCDFLLIESEQIQFSFSTLSCPVRILGSKGKGCLEFCFVLQFGQQEMFAHTVAVSQDMTFGFDSTREVDLVVPAKSNICVVQIKHNAFDLCTQVMERNDLNSRFLKTNCCQALEIKLGVQTYLKQLYYVADHQPEFFSHSRSLDILLEDFLPLLVDSIPRSPTKLYKSRQLPCRFDLVKQAEDYIQTHLEKSITLMDLCEALYTTEHPLTYCFREVFGTTPIAYLKALRLQAVRKQLWLAAPTTAVIGEIAKQYGFWSLGHFSRDYKKMFGELPSQTLKRASTTPTC